MAGNQLGKTLAGGAEAAIHATGRYPQGWDGRVFRKATIGWAAGVTGLSTRDNVQRMLLGRPGSWGTGMIPKECISDIVNARGIPDLVDTIRVKHETSDTSMIGLRSYEQGREKWQGETLDWLWNDEEPPEDIYTEGLTRTNATGGIAWTTFTPLLGMSAVVSRFLLQQHPSRHVTTMTIDDAEHYTPEQRAEIISRYPPHEMEARTKGIPIMGSGRVYPVPEENIREAVIPLAPQWARIVGMDIGYDHPTAAVWMAWDKDTDTVHIYDTYRLRQESPVVHAAAIKSRGEWIPVAWPHDALQHDKGGSCEQIAQQYRDQGVNMLPERATFEDGTSGTEAGIMEILDMMKTGRLRVAEHLNDWWEEFRLYHRKNGLVVKERDDLMSAARHAVMMLRHASTPPRAFKSRSGGSKSWLS